LAAAASGTLLIVPAAVVAGAALDLGRRCSVCGTEIGNDDEAYHLMEETDDGLGARSYRAAATPARAESSSRPMQRGIGRSQAYAKSPHQPGFGESSDPTEEEPEDRRETRFVFDEIEGRLVQEEPELDDPFSDAGVTGEFEDEPERDVFTVAEDLADGLLSGPEMDFEAFWEAPGDVGERLPETPELPTEDLEP